ncbi:TonB-dependent receptor plug domain-containing protein [Niveispirillum sp. SYP-B3756]|nr:TonB-dependent receptor plug domain-containing protein [Niveispirillum sp. SYP-B3756]
MCLIQEWELKKNLMRAGAALVALLAGGTIAPAQQTQVADMGTVEEIIVTGEKQARSVQDTPTSVKVIGKEQIDNELLTSLNDVLLRAANVAGREGRGFSIRGMDSWNVSGAGSGSMATVYVDGAVMPRRATAFNSINMWDVKQVEILRGPQSTMQGRNALAGAIIVTTEDPSFEYKGKARLIVGERGRREYAAAVGGGLVEDMLAFRLTAERADSDGYIRNVTRNEHADYKRLENYRAKLLFTPAGLPDLVVKLNASHAKNFLGENYVDISTPHPFKDRLAFFDAETRTKVGTDIATLDASYSLSPAISLTALTTWSRVKYNYKSDTDRTASPIGTGVLEDNARTLSQELRANLDFGGLTGVTGLYYAKSRTHDKSDTDVGLSLVNVGLARLLVAPPSQGGFGLPQNLANNVMALYPSPYIQLRSRQDTPEDVESYALFADATYEITDKLKLLGGFRWDKEKQTRSVDNVATILSTLPNPASFTAPVSTIVAGINAELARQARAASSSQPEKSVDFGAFLPKAGITYEWTPDLSTSFVAQRGYRSGGVMINTGRASVVEYDPEYVWNYELSLRSQWLDKRLTVNANAFYMDFTDQQVSVQLSGSVYDTQTENAGSSHLYGAELETNYVISDALSVYGSVGYTRTKFDDFTYGSGLTARNLAGYEFRFAPRWTIAGGGTWRDESGIYVNVNANYTTDSYSEIAIQNDRLNSARLLVGAKVGYETEQFGVYAYVTNLLDREYYSSRYVNYQWANLGDPRAFGLVGEVRF